MINYLISVVRTAVPTGWGLLVAWLVGAGVITAEVAGTATGWGPAIAGGLVLLVTTACYAGVRLVETKLPDLLAKVLPVELAGAVTKLILVALVGIPKQPDYQGTVTTPSGGVLPGRVQYLDRAIHIRQPDVATQMAQRLDAELPDAA